MFDKMGITYKPIEMLLKTTINEMDMKQHDSSVSGAISEYTYYEAVIATKQKFKFIK